MRARDSASLILLATSIAAALAACGGGHRQTIATRVVVVASPAVGYWHVGIQPATSIAPRAFPTPLRSLRVQNTWNGCIGNRVVIAFAGSERAHTTTGALAFYYGRGPGVQEVRNANSGPLHLVGWRGTRSGPDVEIEDEHGHRSWHSVPTPAPYAFFGRVHHFDYDYPAFLSNRSPGIYQPRTLITERFTEFGLLTAEDFAAFTGFHGPFMWETNEPTYRIANHEFLLDYFVASGAIERSSNGSNEPYQHSEYVARRFAEDALRGYGGLPRDAKLVKVGGEQMTTYSPGSSPMGPVRVTYEFTWRHADGQLPQDEIVVNVDNLSRPWPFHPNHLNRLYRMWRRIGDPVDIAPVRPGQEPKARSPLDAFALGSCQWPFKGNLGNQHLDKMIYAYAASGYLDPVQLARPAYDMYFGKVVITIDAESGQFLYDHDTR